MYFNNYLEDSKRPQLPEHPSNTAKASMKPRRPPGGDMGPPHGPMGFGPGPMMGPPGFRGGFRGGFDHCKSAVFAGSAIGPLLAVVLMPIGQQVA